MVLDDSCGATIELSCKRPVLPKPTNNATLVEPKSPSVENSQDEIVSQDPAYAGLTDTGRTIDLKGYDVGAVVKVKGGLGVFGGEKQVRLERICTCYGDYRPNFHQPQHPYVSFGLNPRVLITSHGT